MPGVLMGERYRRAVDYIARQKTHLESREDIFGGEAVIKGTRIPARFVADVVGSGGTLDDFCENYPDIPRGGDGIHLNTRAFSREKRNGITLREV